MLQSNPSYREGSWDTKGINKLPKVTIDNGKFEPKQSNFKTHPLSRPALLVLSEPLLVLIILLKEENQTVCQDIKFSFKKSCIFILKYQFKDIGKEHNFKFKIF